MVQNTSFLQRLSHEQTQSFLDELYPSNEGFDFSFILKQNPYNSELYYCVKVFHFGWDSPKIIHLEEYSSNLSFPSKWIQYLMSIFGDEYKKAFTQRCIYLFDDN